jgi:hypothetical protein
MIGSQIGNLIPSPSIALKPKENKPKKIIIVFIYLFQNPVIHRAALTSANYNYLLLTNPHLPKYTFPFYLYFCIGF